MQFCKKYYGGMPTLKYKYFDHIMWFDEFFWCPRIIFFSNFSSYQKPLGADFRVFSLFLAKFFWTSLVNRNFRTLKVAGARFTTYSRRNIMLGHVNVNLDIDIFVISEQKWLKFGLHPGIFILDVWACQISALYFLL